MIEPSIRLLFLANLGSTLFMVGVIWFVQVVHYPLLAKVGSRECPAYEQRHTALTTWVVAPPMLIEAATGVLLVWFRPTGISTWCLWTGLALLGVIWLSTALVQVPCHEALSRGFDPFVQKRLVLTNWLRTAAWTSRGVLMLWLLWSSLSVGTLAPNHLGSTNLAKLEVGDRAPDFLATTHDGKKIRLSDYLGKRALVLFFYPKDGTPTCTQEACAFRDSYEKFIDAEADVIGVSSDTEESHRAFVRQNNLSFPLISDRDGALREAFAVPRTLGLFPGRVTYVIDKAGIVRQIFSAQFASDEHVKQALQAVGAASRTSQ